MQKRRAIWLAHRWIVHAEAVQDLDYALLGKLEGRGNSVLTVKRSDRKLVRKRLEGMESTYFRRGQSRSSFDLSTPNDR